jgi:hypothetical protein
MGGHISPDPAAQRTARVPAPAFGSGRGLTQTPPCPAFGHIRKAAPMSRLLRREQTHAILDAKRDGQTYCPSCGTPLNYDRGALPNTAVYNTATETVTCHRCNRSSSTTPEPAPRPATADSRLAYTSFTTPKE